MRFTMMFFLLAPVTAATPVSAQTAPAVAQAAATILPDELARHIARLAADSMLGRATPSPGLEKTAQYVADQFQKFGLKPGGANSTWLQRYPVPQESTESEDSENAMAPKDSAATAPNTIGLLEGSDPALKQEYVVVMAHMDGIGVLHENDQSLYQSMKPEHRNGFADSIFNGADDNASGTAGLLELAKAFSQPGARPKRSLLFLAVSGHSKTFLGSRHFTAHAPVPPGQIVAVVNLDMIGRNWRDQILAIGEEHSTIGATLQQVVTAHPELRMAVIGDSIWLPSRRGIMQGLLWDHHLFYPASVPGVTFFNDYHIDYREVTDTPDAIDAEKASRVVQLAFYLGQELANANNRPAWTKAGKQARADVDTLSAKGLEELRGNWAHRDSQHTRMNSWRQR